MIERLLPPTVATCAVRSDDPDAALWPEEAALVAGAVAPRRAEFATARRCARQALRRFGVPEAPILRGPRREPLWPEGIVGSITHCTGYRAAAVARTADFLTLGIDAEPHEALPAEVARRVLGVEEQSWVREAAAGVHWGRVVFSAKESLYKAWFPLAGTWLDFDDAVITIDPAADSAENPAENPAVGVFRGRLRVEPPAGVPAAFAGRYLIEDGLVLTAIAVPV